MCWILKRMEEVVMRLYSSHPVVPQINSPSLKFGSPESRTLATPYPVMAYECVFFLYYHSVNRCDDKRMFVELHE